MSISEVHPEREVIIIESTNMDSDLTINLARPYAQWAKCLADSEEAILHHGIRLRVKLWMIYHGEIVLVWTGEAK